VVGSVLKNASNWLATSLRHCCSDACNRFARDPSITRPVRRTAVSGRPPDIGPRKSRGQPPARAECNQIVSRLIWSWTTRTSRSKPRSPQWVVQDQINRLNNLNYNSSNGPVVALDFLGAVYLGGRPGHRASTDWSGYARISRKAITRIRQQWRSESREPIAGVFQNRPTTAPCF